MRCSRGSMSRYANLVESALTQLPATITELKIKRVHLSIQHLLPTWVSNRIRVWLDHIYFGLIGTWSIKNVDTDLTHILDGSYAYLVGKAVSSTTIITVHDIIPVIQQTAAFGHQSTSFLAQRVIRRSLQGMRRSHLLIAVSTSTKLDLLKWVGIPGEKVVVVPVALDPAWSQFVGDINLTVNRRAEVLHIGNNSHYKNRAGVIRIFSLLRKKHDIDLVMAGPTPSRQLVDMVEGFGLSRHVRFIENPTDEELARLYSSASVFLFPSIYEGFGWPPLEAMVFGCPVVCSDAASLPEVVGEAALMAPAQNEAELAELCSSILSDPVLAESLAKKGREHAASFTLERMGRQLLDVYKAALNA